MVGSTVLGIQQENQQTRCPPVKHKYLRNLPRVRPVSPIARLKPMAKGISADDARAFAITLIVPFFLTPTPGASIGLPKQVRRCVRASFIFVHDRAHAVRLAIFRGQ